MAAVASAIIVVAAPFLIYGRDTLDPSHHRGPGHSFEVAFLIFAVECGGVLLAISILPEIKRTALEAPAAKDLFRALLYARVAFWLGSLLALLSAAVAALSFL